MRKRFDVEVTKETKLFFLSGMKNNLYQLRDVQNLARFISVIIPRELDFKKQHPHILVDRIELLSNNQNNLTDDSKTDVALFGYVRGGPLDSEKNFYIPGLGYIKAESVKQTIDPVVVEPSKKKGAKKIRNGIKNVEEDEESSSEE